MTIRADKVERARKGNGRYQERIQGGRERPRTGEAASSGMDLFSQALEFFVGNRRENPDPILRAEAAGSGLELYELMEAKDAHLAALLQTRKLAVVGRPWAVLPNEEDPQEARAQKIAELAQRDLAAIPMFSQDRYELLDAVGKGLAVSEVVWEFAEGRWRVGALKSRHQRRFVFGKGSELRLLTDGNLWEGEVLPDKKFLVHTFQGTWENPYGRGVDSVCYWMHFFKKNALKFWAIFAEKFGSPTSVGKHAPGATQDQQDSLLSSLKSIQQESAVIIPNTMEVDLLEAQRTGSVNTYETLCEYLDRQMSKAVLGQTLTTQESDRGTQALGRVHGDVRQDVVVADAASLDSVINGQLLRWWTDFNFGMDVPAPVYATEVDPPEDLVALASRDRILIKDIGLPVEMAYLYDRFGIPRPDEGSEDLIVVPQAQQVGIGGGLPFGGNGGQGAFAEGDREAARIIREADHLYRASLSSGVKAFEDLAQAVAGRVQKKTP